MPEPRGKGDNKVCGRCHGQGYVFLLPRGANPFMMPIEAIAIHAQRRPCPECYGKASHD